MSGQHQNPVSHHEANLQHQFARLEAVINVTLEDIIGVSDKSFLGGVTMEQI